MCMKHCKLRPFLMYLAQDLSQYNPEETCQTKFLVNLATIRQKTTENHKQSRSGVSLTCEAKMAVKLE